MPPPAPGLRLLLLNWRDLRHPKAGGAEVYNHEVARRLVERGHEVTVFTGTAPGLPESERIDGVRIVRRGGAVTTRFHAMRWLRRERHTRPGAAFDVVLEEINTLPYLARRWSRLPTVLVVHQLAREVWWYEAPRLLAGVGYALEPWVLRLCRGPAIALSDSTRRDLLDLGFDPAAVVTVAPGLADPAAHAPDVAKRPGELVYVGRVAPSKRVGDLVEALAEVRARGVEASLTIIGRGPRSELARVLRDAHDLGVANHVEHAGFLSEGEKRGRIARAQLLVLASVREGWGLVVTEANALGTPAVVYRRPGLVDSTVDGVTGLVTEPTPAGLAAGIERALREPGLYERLRAGALAHSRGFTWERTTEAVERIALAVAVPEAAPLAPIGASAVRA